MTWSSTRIAARSSTTRRSRPATGPSSMQYQLNGGLNQQWRIVTLANGNDERDQRVQRQGARRPVVLDQQRDPIISSTSSTGEPTSSGSCWRRVTPRRDRLRRQRVQRQGARRPRFSTSNGTRIDHSTSSTGGPTSGGYSSRWPTAMTWSSTRIAARSSTTRRSRPATGPVDPEYQLNGGANQQWRIVPLANGNDEVFNAESGKVLDDPSFSHQQRDRHRAVPAQRGSQPAVEAVGGG